MTLDPLALVAIRAGRVAQVIEERDFYIREARLAGYSLRDIAKAANVSHTTVATIVNGAS